MLLGVAATCAGIVAATRAGHARRDAVRSAFDVAATLGGAAVVAVVVVAVAAAVCRGRPTRGLVLALGLALVLAGTGVAVALMAGVVVSTN